MNFHKKTPNSISKSLRRIARQRVWSCGLFTSSTDRVSLSAHKSNQFTAGGMFG